MLHADLSCNTHTNKHTHVHKLPGDVSSPICFQMISWEEKHESPANSYKNWPFFFLQWKNVTAQMAARITTMKTGINIFFSASCDTLLVVVSFPTWTRAEPVQEGKRKKATSGVNCIFGHNWLWQCANTQVSGTIKPPVAQKSEEATNNHKTTANIPFLSSTPPSWICQWKSLL